MKKIIVAFIAILLLLSTLSGCTCNLGDLLNGNTKYVKKEPVANRYDIKNADDMIKPTYKLESCYKHDENQYVFLYYLGRVENVPLQSNSTVVYFNGINYELDLTQTHATTEQIAESSTHAKNHCVSKSENTAVQGGIEIGFEESVKVDAKFFAFGGEGEMKFSQKVNISGAREKTNSNAVSSTVGESYTRGSTNSCSEEITMHIKLDENSKIGYYRWVYMGTYDCFAYVYVDFDTETVFLDYTAYLVGSHYSLDYSDSSIFEDNSTDMLTFDISKLENGLVIPQDVKEGEPLKSNDTSNNNDQKPADYAGGTGTQKDPYLIKNAVHLANISKNPTAYYKLVNDIDLSFSAWTPFENKAFIDGNNHTISNVNRSISDKKLTSAIYEGLFTINSGTIQNLTLKDFSFNGKKQKEGEWVYVGNLCGKNAGTISNVTVSGSSIALLRLNSSIGGIAGINNGIIENCSVLSTRFEGTGDCGGICGTNDSGAQISNVSFVGDKISGGVKENEDKVLFHYQMTSLGLVDDGGRSWGGIVGFNAANASIKDITIQYVYMIMDADYSGEIHSTPKMGYLVGDNSGLLGGNLTYHIDECGEYRKIAFNVLTGHGKYYFHNNEDYNGLIGKNDDPNNIKWSS